MGALALLAGCRTVTRLRQGLEFSVVNERLIIRGEISARTAAAFADVLKQNPQVSTIVLQHITRVTDVPAVFAIGRLIRARGLHTVLQSDSDIHAEAGFMFLAGVERRMVAGAQIGLGSWTARDFSRAPDFAGASEYTVEMLGSDAFYLFALRKGPSDGIYVMTEDEIAQFGLLTAPVQRFE